MVKQKYSCIYPNNLRRYRKQQGLQRSAVCRLLGLPKAKQLSLLEKGAVMPDSLSLFKLCFLYAASPFELYGEVMQKVNSNLKELMEELPTIEF